MTLEVPPTTTSTTAAGYGPTRITIPERAQMGPELCLLAVASQWPLS